jgi:hypothetical protein
VVVSVPSSRLQLGLLSSPELSAPQPLSDPAAAPSLHVELHHSTSTPVVSGPLPLGPDGTLVCSLEHMFKHKKGPDIIDRLINTSLELRLCNSTSKAVLATASVDLLPFGLGSNSIEDGALEWQPAATNEVFKVRLHLSTVSGSGQGSHLRLFHLLPAGMLNSSTAPGSAHMPAHRGCAACSSCCNSPAWLASGPAE